MRFLWHELARAEYGEAVDYYLSHAGPVVACNFKTALNQVLSLLEEHPAIGAETSRDARRIPLHGFPFNLVYRLRADSIVIVAIANQARRPGVLGRAVMRLLPHASLLISTPLGRWS